ncbi:alpha/beta hydrolase [Actinosynnema sp. NPDC047251]|uniref:TAP domain containing protein n=1 Tax=Saccharothrix espanaensis (strain ATCC 51144 / DSM 44229 / JCM 9112 / NBRC 15066 / NRRL 15764) TaxID=1179773 RepID=K0K2R2_SACES|nr:alpha/beta hydrolase [Saccharothrix espanaensis]CCH34535.1 TAP domain containing protein [Saccharothrix espanaensis DSM 44229]
MRKAVLAVSAVALVATLPAVAQAQEQDQRTPLHAQSIAWAPCTDIPAPNLECGTYKAPLDWRNVGNGKTITVAVSRLKPRSGKVRGSVLTNPGGPGGPGRTLPLLYQSRSKLVDNFEIIGIDPRGTGTSTNVTCANVDFLSVADPRDRSRANVELIYDAAELQAAACQRNSGEFGKVVNTEQTVKDLDLLRHLLGRDKINWIGYSGGTWMGAYYATYFPHRVDKFVLDSNTEFTTTFQDIFDEFGRGFERRFRVDFLPWVAKYDSLYHLGTTAEQVRRKYEETRARLADNPIQRPDGTIFNGVTLDLVLVRAQYSKTEFPDAAKTLSELSNPTVTTAAADVRYPDATNATLYSVACNDTKFQGGRDHLAREANRLGKQYPLIGSYQLLAPCAFWNRPPLHLKTPTGKGVPPILMVQSVRDPATPVEGAQRAHEKFAGSRLLTVTDEGDHGIYGFGNQCVDNVVESFIVDGKVPTKDLTCKGTPLPDPTKPTINTRNHLPFNWL